MEAGNKNSPNAVHACRRRQLKWILKFRGYSWTILSPGDINTEAWSTSQWLANGWLPYPGKQLLSRNHNRCKNKVSLGLSRLKPGCSSDNMMMMTTYRNFSSWFICKQKRFGAHNLATLITKSTYMQHTHRYSKAGCLLYNESTSSSHIHSFSLELFPLRAAVSLVSTKFSRDIFCLSAKLIASSLLFQPRRRLKGWVLRVVRWLGDLDGSWKGLGWRGGWIL